MIYPSAYDTTACKGFITSKLVDALEKARLQNYLIPSSDGFDDILAVTRTTYLQEAVPSFIYPVLVKNTRKPGEHYVYFDARPYMRTDSGSSDGTHISNINGYTAARGAAVMQKAWAETQLSYMRNLSSMPLAAYCSWMGDNIGKRVALDPGDQLSVTVLAGVFYLNLFMPADERTVVEKVEMINLISKATGVKAGVVSDIVNDRSRIDNLDEFCQIVKDYTGSTRLRDLNAAVVFGILGGTWYGANSREMVAVATECPWLWMIMLYSAINDRGFHHSGIAKMLERSSFKRQTEQYSRALAEYIASFRTDDVPGGIDASKMRGSPMVAQY